MTQVWNPWGIIPTPSHPEFTGLQLLTGTRASNSQISKHLMILRWTTSSFIHKIHPLHMTLLKHACFLLENVGLSFTQRHIRQINVSLDKNHSHLQLMPFQFYTWPCKTIKEITKPLLRFYKSARLQRLSMSERKQRNLKEEKSSC